MACRAILVCWFPPAVGEAEDDADEDADGDGDDAEALGADELVADGLVAMVGLVAPGCVAGAGAGVLLLSPPQAAAPPPITASIASAPTMRRMGRGWLTMGRPLFLEIKSGSGCLTQPWRVATGCG